MAEPVLIVLISTGGTILVALLGAWAKKWADGKSAEAAEAAAEREQWKTLVDQWRADVRELREMRAEDRRLYEAEVRELRVRIEQLERDHEVNRERIQVLTADLSRLSDWARQVVALLRDNNIDFPSLPFDIGGDDD